MLTPTARRELLIRAREHRIKVARIEEQLERLQADRAFGKQDLSPFTGADLEGWIAARAPSLMIDPGLISGEFKERVRQELAGATARVREVLSEESFKVERKPASKPPVPEYEYLPHACPLCNGCVRISPTLKRTVCTKCGVTLYPLPEHKQPEAKPLRRRKRYRPNKNDFTRIIVKSDVFDMILRESQSRMARTGLTMAVEWEAKRRLKNRGPLSLTDCDILHLLSVGWSHENIAQALDISRWAVPDRLALIRTALGVKSTLAAVSAAIRHGYIP